MLRLRRERGHRIDECLATALRDVHVFFDEDLLVRLVGEAARDQRYNRVDGAHRRLGRRLRLRGTEPQQRRNERQHSGHGASVSGADAGYKRVATYIIARIVSSGGD